MAVSLLESGAEVKRAEESAERVALALGAASCEVLSFVSFILLTYDSADGESFTKTRRVKNSGADFSRFERLNALSRKICESKMGLEIAESEFREANKNTSVKPLKSYIQSMIVAFCFSLFFGGGIKEAISSAISANTIQFMKIKGDIGFENKLIFTCVTSFLAGAVCLFTVKIGMAENYDMVAIGNIMLLAPGISVMSAVRDIISGEILFGITRLFESILTALSIAIGFALPSLVL